MEQGGGRASRVLCYRNGSPGPGSGGRERSRRQRSLRAQNITRPLERVGRGVKGSRTQSL
eukprot:566816-Prymnesium_polylepis.1